MKRGFNTSKYIEIQKKEILKRMNKFNRLYLEVGGHLCYDGHASRVLPGYDPKTKLKLLKNLKKSGIDIEIIYCVNAKDIESKKVLGDFDLNYKKQTIRDIGTFAKNNLKVNHLVITRYERKNSKTISQFKEIIGNKVKNIYLHNEIPNYSKSPNYAVKGYKKDSPIKIKANSRLIIITGAAGGSGKMGTAMSQIYYDIRNKINSGYAKLETFPVWNLPLNHPINLAYEAATADLQDKNEIDPYHLKYHHKKAVNYNRDIKNFGILMDIAKIITKKKFPFGYKSPTDMGIGNTKAGIINDNICRKAAIKEINRRMKFYTKEYKSGRESKATIERMEEIMNKI